MIKITLIALLTLSALALGNLSAEDEELGPRDRTIKRLTAAEWCFKHDVPKDRCVQCDPSLIPKLQKEDDWCAKHKVAQSICVECDPDVKKYLDQIRPVEKKKE